VAPVPVHPAGSPTPDPLSTVSVRSGRGSVVSMPQLRRAADPTRPGWRGWLHAAAVPVALVLATVLITLAPAGAPTVGCVVYGVALVMLFGISALYHRVAWAPRARAVLRRMDHSMIFAFIAGSYTPFALTLLHGASRWAVLAVVWGGAVVGIGLRMVFSGAPRWAYVPVYVGLGWVAVFVLDPIRDGGGIAALALLLIGGVVYSAGGVVYALRRPDPLPQSFGYHEVFHAATLVAAVCHYIAVMFAIQAVT
jgi:hemolysin III